MNNIKEIHHIGIVVKNVAKELEKYRALGFKIKDEVVIDNEQKVKVGQVGSSDGGVIELLEPLDESSPIWKFYKDGGGQHHICIEVDNIEAYVRYIKENKLGVRLTQTTTSVFDGRKVCFIGLKDRQIMELIEQS